METLVAIDPEAAWAAVIARDASHDGRFVYGVRTTGVYCRPSCPSRRPLRTNVAFYETPADAERHGLRACRRCRPRAPRTPTATLIARACQWLESHVEQRVTLATLAHELGVSPFHLQRTFKRVMGVSPRSYLESLRTRSVRSALTSSERVSDVALGDGFSSTSRFYEHTRSQLAMTPTAYRAGGRGCTIEFATAPSPLGRVLVASTDRGVCTVSLGDSDAALIQALADEFPNATRVRATASQCAALEAVLARLRGDPLAAQLPLDVRGTAFQRRVWEALQAIPPGETRSYRELAVALGAPRGARAVARACASNRIAMLIPCHRVVRGDGDLAGYRWGVERKRALLAGERLAPRSRPRWPRRSRD